MAERDLPSNFFAVREFGRKRTRPARLRRGALTGGPSRLVPFSPRYTLVVREPRRKSVVSAGSSFVAPRSSISPIASLTAKKESALGAKTQYARNVGVMLGNESQFQ